MPSVELSKLPGISAPRTVATSERTQIEARVAAGAGRTPSAAAGLIRDVTGAPEGVTPPVDSERVDQIRAALRDGSYPLVPAKIVDAMIAAQVSLALPERS